MSKILTGIISAIVALSVSLTFMFGCGKPVNDTDYKVYDNVILFIGDGMGENHLEAAKQKLGIELNMETFPVRGQSKTNSILRITTDSAAGGSALSSGMKTINGYVGVSAFDPTASIIKPVLLTEAAISLGKSAGVVTTDFTTGATPASFSSHTSSRGNDADISRQQLESDLTLIWGGADENITPENAAENGFTYVQSISDIEALSSGERSFGQFNYGELKKVQNTEVTPTIETMTKSAIDILDDNENGFFLMVEGAQIDKYCHDKELDNAVVQLAELDKAVKAALDYAKEDGSTLVVVTADHETGGVTYSEIQGGYYCTIGSHTSSNVPLFVSDEAAGFENGAAYENKDISCQLALCLGMEKGTFPVCVPVLGKKDES